MASASATTSVPVAASARRADAFAPALGPIEQLASRGERRGPARLTAEHLGELDDAPLAIEPFDLGDRAPVALALGDPELDIGVRRDLRQVRDAQDLVATRECPQAAADGVGTAPADARVDLVEDERGGRV